MRQMKCFCGQILQHPSLVDVAARKHLAQVHHMRDVPDEFISDLRSERALKCSACGHRVVNKNRYALIHDMWEHVGREHPGQLGWDEATMQTELSKNFGKYGPYEMGLGFPDRS